MSALSLTSTTEIAERERRSRNIMVFNCHTIDNSSIADTALDKYFVDSILEQINSSEYSKRKIVCLGPVHHGSPRPLRFTLNSIMFYFQTVGELRSKFSILRSSLASVVEHFLIIVLVETWLRDNILDFELELTN